MTLAEVVIAALAVGDGPRSASALSGFRCGADVAITLDVLGLPRAEFLGAGAADGNPAFAVGDAGTLVTP
jgi:hypothetical protein